MCSDNDDHCPRHSIQPVQKTSGCVYRRAFRGRSIQGSDGMTAETKDSLRKRWTSRADSLTTFKNAFRVVVHALETLEEDGDIKAAEHLSAVLQFKFIITLVATQHILSNLVGLTAILQKVDMDLVEAILETKVVMQIFRDERENMNVWDVIFKEASDIAAEFQIEPSVQHQNDIQQHMANYDIADPKTYWRVALYNVFLDHLLQVMDNRILKNEDRFCAKLLIPSRLPESLPEHVNAVYDAYSPDLTSSREAFGNEVRRWKTRWDLIQRPASIIQTLDTTSADDYPSIYTVLSVLFTMPATSASCELSFSSMRRIKSYMRSTMTGDRLSALGVLHIHRDMDIEVDRIINKFASVKCRNINFL